MGLLIIAILIGVGIYFISSENKKMYNSQNYSDWYYYYIDNGYSHEEAKQYAAVLYRRGETLAGNGIKPNYSSKGTSAKGTFSAAAGAGQTTAVRELTPEEKRASELKNVNYILMVASALIAFGMLSMINRLNDKMVAPLYVIITLIFLVSGLAIYKGVKFLQPVGKAFSYIALILVPFFAISFFDMLGGYEIPFWRNKDAIISNALIISSIFSLVSYAITASLLKNKFAGTLSFVWFCAIFWSIAVNTSIPSAAVPYLILIPAIVLSYISAAIYISKAKWVPEGFRPAIFHFYKEMPAFYVFITIILMSIQNFGHNYAAFRSLYIALIAGIFAIQWFSEKKYKSLVWLRFAGQGFILVVAADILNFSIYNSYTFSGGKTFEWAPLLMSLAWAISFFIQALASLLIKHRSKEDRKIEDAAGIASLVGIVSTLVISLSLNRVAYGVVACTVIGITAVLGIIYAIVKKNLRWLYASLTAVIILPFVLDDDVFASNAWTYLQYFIYFACFAFASTLSFIATKKIDNKSALWFTAIALGTLSIFTIVSGLQLEFFSIAVLIPALCFSLLSVLTKDKKGLREVSIYLIAYTVIALLQDVVHYVCGCRGFFSACNNNVGDAQKFLQTYIASAALVITSILYDNEDRKNNKLPTRLAIGYYFFTIIGASIAVFARIDQNNLGIGIIYLLTEAAILGVSAFSQRRWMAISSTIALLVGALYMSGLYDQAFIWLIMLGLALIGFAVWKLVAINNNDKKK